MTTKDDATFNTLAVHAGERADLSRVSPVVTPIHASVGYTYADSAELDAVLGGSRAGYVYSTRYENPTVAAFEQAIAQLEGTEAAYAFASGMSALHMALLAAGVRAGRSVVAAADIYGATYSLLQTIFGELGADIHLVDVTDLPVVAAAVETHKPAAILVETFSNPLMKVADLAALAEISRANGSTLLVDNTFCSPYLCNPAAFGADMVIHSATKFIGGHGDVMAGVVATSRDLRSELLRLNKLVGSSMGPFEAWLALRGVKTLGLRMRQQCDNALTVATRLGDHPKIGRINYAYLPDHPQAALARQVTNGKGGGAVVSFEIKNGTKADAFAFMDALKLIQPATSLGDIYSLVLYPAISSHRSLSSAERAKIGITDGTLRISAGIEDSEDIWRDVEQALAKL